MTNRHAPHLILTLCLLMLALAAGCATKSAAPVLSVSPAFPAEGVRIGVVPFTPATDPNGAIVADALAAELMRVPGVTLVERTVVNQVMAKFGTTWQQVLADRDVRLVNEAGVDALLVGDLSAFAEREGDYDKPVSTVAYSARVVDIRSGEVLLAFSCNADWNNYKPAALAQAIAREAVEDFMDTRGIKH
ncbi:MAG: hypothetical protein AB7E47_13150 [Desulfovibrionaceae bacterium]